MLIVIVALVFLVASWGLAIVRKSVTVSDLALWAIATYMILPHIPLDH